MKPISLFINWVVSCACCFSHGSSYDVKKFQEDSPTCEEISSPCSKVD